MGVEKINQPDRERRRALLEELMIAGDKYLDPALESSAEQKATVRQLVSDLRKQCLAAGITQEEIRAAIEERKKNKT